MKRLAFTLLTGILAVVMVSSTFAAQGSGTAKGPKAGNQGQVCPMGQASSNCQICPNNQICPNVPPKDGTGNQKGKVKKSGKQGVCPNSQVCPNVPPKDGTGNKRRGK
jgi:hypothetical protein